MLCHLCEMWMSTYLFCSQKLLSFVWCILNHLRPISFVRDIFLNPSLITRWTSCLFLFLRILASDFFLLAISSLISDRIASKLFYAKFPCWSAYFLLLNYHFLLMLLVKENIYVESCTSNTNVKWEEPIIRNLFHFSTLRRYLSHNKWILVFHEKERKLLYNSTILTKWV